MQGKSNRFRSCNTQRRNIRKDIPIVQGQQCTHSPKSAMECCGFLRTQSTRKCGWEGICGTIEIKLSLTQSTRKCGWEDSLAIHFPRLVRRNPHESVDGKVLTYRQVDINIGRNPHESVDGKCVDARCSATGTRTQSTRKCGWEAKSLIQLKICMVSTQSMRKRGWEVDGKLKPETPNCEAIHA